MKLSNFNTLTVAFCCTLLHRCNTIFVSYTLVISSLTLFVALRNTLRQHAKCTKTAVFNRISAVAFVASVAQRNNQYLGYGYVNNKYNTFFSHTPTPFVAFVAPVAPVASVARATLLAFLVALPLFSAAQVQQVKNVFHSSEELVIPSLESDLFQFLKSTTRTKPVFEIRFNTPTQMFLYHTKNLKGGLAQKVDECIESELYRLKPEIGTYAAVTIEGNILKMHLFIITKSKIDIYYLKEPRKFIQRS